MNESGHGFFDFLRKKKKDQSPPPEETLDQQWQRAIDQKVKQAEANNPPAALRFVDSKNQCYYTIDQRAKPYTVVIIDNLLKRAENAFSEAVVIPEGETPRNLTGGKGNAWYLHEQNDSQTKIAANRLERFKNADLFDSAKNNTWLGSFPDVEGVMKAYNTNQTST